jgi:hypothetical protein
MIWPQTVTPAAYVRAPLAMPKTAPLRLLLFRNPEDQDTDPYENAIAWAFQGGRDAGGYLVTGEDLGVQWQVFSSAPQQDAAATLDSFCHTMTIVLVDNHLLKSDDALWNWLAACWARVRSSDGRHAMLVVAMDERTGRAFLSKRPENETLQLLYVHDLGERAIRPTMLALRLLHGCRILLASALPDDHEYRTGHLRLFISHAKLDGLPLAHALKRQIEALGWLEDFYDVDDLPAGSDWQKELERGVGSSLIVILRTEAYDGRYWCQQEVLWADEYATPAVLVDCRTSLNRPAGTLPLDRIPSVRIPDGNLVRILFLAVREGLRFLMFMRHVEQMKAEGQLPSPVEMRVFSYPPSMAALLRACHALAKTRGVASTAARLILYPDPPLRSGQYEAAQALVSVYAPGAKLRTPLTIAASSP